MAELNSTPHRRYNPLLREWVLVSPQRAARPWQGQTEPSAPRPAGAAGYEADCYLCPGNQRAGGARNPNYAGVFVFDNDYPALAETAAPARAPSPLLRAEPEAGVCRVICFSPRHDLTLSRLPQPALAAVVDCWAEQYRELGALPAINSVTIFENRGAMMGASNPHPHGQIWANASLPNQFAREQAALGDYRREQGACLLCDYLELELARQERVVCANEAFVAVVPYWAVWPFEALVLSRAHRSSLAELTATERGRLADLLRRLMIRYDNLFETPFPSSWGFHQAPTDAVSHPESHLHAHFFPPLLRSATVRKFLVGYELLAMPQRDLTPEAAAERLRGQSERHYLEALP